MIPATVYFNGDYIVLPPPQKLFRKHSLFLVSKYVKHYFSDSISVISFSLGDIPFLFYFCCIFRLAIDFLGIIKQPWTHAVWYKTKQAKLSRAETVYHKNKM